MSEKSENNSLCGKLKVLREMSGCSQKEIGRLINVSRSGYQHYESGEREPSIRSLRVLAAFYGIPLADLVAPDVPMGKADLAREDSFYRRSQIEAEDQLIKHFRKLTLRQQKSLLELAEDMSHKR